MASIWLHTYDVSWEMGSAETSSWSIKSLRFNSRQRYHSQPQNAAYAVAQGKFRIHYAKLAGMKPKHSRYISGSEATKSRHILRPTKRSRLMIDATIARIINLKRRMYHTSLFHVLVLARELRNIAVDSLSPSADSSGAENLIKRDFLERDKTDTCLYLFMA